MTAPTKDRAKLLSHWKQHLARVNRELTRARLHRQIWEAVSDAILGRYPSADSTFLRSYSQVYGHSQCMTVRRLAESSKDTTESLWWLLEHIARNPHVLTRSGYVEPIARSLGEPGSWEYEAASETFDAEFTEHFGEGSNVDAELVRGHQDVVSAVARGVKAFADTVVAHMDPLDDGTSVSFDEMHLALDILGLVADECNILIDHCTVRDQVTIQGDWRECLRDSLFPSYPDPRRAKATQ